MATSRVINTNFWKDNYIVDLDPIEKLLFLYFITNPRTNLAGMYEINIREVAFDTGVDKEMVIKILNRFCADGKMYYERGWLVLTNFLKYQRPNPSIVKGIEKTVSELPEWLQKKISLQNEDNQMSIFVVSDSTQTDTSLSKSGSNSSDIQSVPSLYPESPQYNIIKSNLNKIKLNKPKAKSDTSDGQAARDFKKNNLTATQKRNYARAVRADEEQDKRITIAANRTPGDIERIFGGGG